MLAALRRRLSRSAASPSPPGGAAQHVPASDTAPPSSSETTGAARSGGRRWVGTAARTAAFCAAVLGLLVGLGFAQRADWLPTVAPLAVAAAEDARYICPMMCTPPLAEPGRCPVCGMELKKLEDDGGDGVSVTLDPAARRLAGIGTAEVTREVLTREIRTVGELAFDEGRDATIAAYVDGRLERLFADYVGVPVKEGDDLAVLYSPDLYTAQREYLSARGALASGAAADAELSRQLAVAARDKLIELGMTADQIEALRERGTAETRLRIRSPLGGTVVEKLKTEGQYVARGEPILKIADLSAVWLMLELFPEDAAAVRFATKVRATLRSLPGEEFVGRAAFIDPTVDPETRTVGVRVEMLNPDGRLRPGDLAAAVVETLAVPPPPGEPVYDPELAMKYVSPMHPQIVRDEPGECPVCGMDLVPASELGFAESRTADRSVLTVPRDAVLRAGSNSVVYVETDPGRFELRTVELGPTAKGRTVVVSGLEAGETVATGGNFLIDSQMQLAGNPSLIDPTRAKPLEEPADGPMSLPNGPAVVVADETGAALDALFAAYFQVQTALAADEPPPAGAIAALSDAADRLDAADLAAAADQVAVVERHVPELATDDLDAARVAFKPLSHAVLRLSAAMRGPESAGALTQFHCPMGPGGGSDWLEPGRLARDEMRNPYMGAAMLKCGSKVREIAAAESPAGPGNAGPN
ncbi:efflux RND transporter periplasmic adaptor subunit [Alienimonas californiensis]|uniref:Cation efflux system protein CusB n=1 Tax=Alienimonas californiensis TaxID=2527989 RepID=A0A517PBE8_9PLAN|nr:efflux RND transporter periplasmic adaptor subunit [Alienimonas californiensis]QDT16690.1 Cation efflux system protein CusB precursor [Alienimonas californiensis]